VGRVNAVAEYPNTPPPPDPPPEIGVHENDPDGNVSACDPSAAQVGGVTRNSKSVVAAFRLLATEFLLTFELRLKILAMLESVTTPKAPLSITLSVTMKLEEFVRLTAVAVVELGSELNVFPITLPNDPDAVI
jgi:hypothetical protein